MTQKHARERRTGQSDCGKCKGRDPESESEGRIIMLGRGEKEGLNGGIAPEPRRRTEWIDVHGSEIVKGGGR